MNTHFKLKAMAALLLLIGLSSCQLKEQQPRIEQPTEAQIEAIITQEVDSLYAVYQRFEYDWIQFYAPEFTAIYPGTPLATYKRADLTKQWEDIYKTYEVKLIERGRPTVIASSNMAMSYNSFNEIFINKTTQDTTKNVGTYIITWKKQPDASWKIVFETLHKD
jgi:ketosteroid isomerase-like protein